MHDMGLATIIGPVDKDASGKPLSASMKSTIEDSGHGTAEARCMNQ